ncbi:MAG: FtsX-like permease family protein [Rikenellaceae bacterium]
MRLEYFIAKRIATPSGGSKPSVIVRVAAISVALSVAVMILSLAIIFGFDSSLRSNLMSVDAHVTVKDFRGTTQSSSPPIKYSDAIVEAITSTPGYLHHSCYGVTNVMFRHGGNVEGARLTGVDSLFDWSLYQNENLRGELPRRSLGDGVRYKDILLSEPLAQAMGVDIADRLELLYSTNDQSISRDLYRVCGVYSTGIEESDKVSALCDLGSLARTMNWEAGGITGYHITTDNLKQIPKYAESLNDKLFHLDDQSSDYLGAYTFEELNPYVINWLKTHDVNAAVIITIMLIVAAFNMASALLIMVLERKQMVGVLKSMGMSNQKLGRMFIIRSLYIIVAGVVWGNAIGIGAALIQKWWQVIKLDSGGYLLSSIPIELDAWWIITLNCLVIAAIVILITIPSRFVTKVEPCEAINR